jgi:hypothetical protein
MAAVEQVDEHHDRMSDFERLRWLGWAVARAPPGGP